MRNVIIAIFLSLVCVHCSALFIMDYKAKHKPPPRHYLYDLQECMDSLPPHVHSDDDAVAIEETQEEIRKCQDKLEQQK